MKYVHSLIRTEMESQNGWCAPIEVGEDAPQYINFAIPVDKGRIDDLYTCELATFGRHERGLEIHQLIRHGTDSFRLKVGEKDLWFNVRPVARNERSLPYVGTLSHPDFVFPFVEIESREFALMDQLCLSDGLVVIGCDPAHYLVK